MGKDVLKDDFFTEDEIAEVEGIKLTTLRTRIYTGTNHPPCTKIGKDYFFPKQETREWYRAKPVRHEVRSA